MSILYNLRRINEICREHVDNNFHRLPKKYVGDLANIMDRITTLMNDTLGMMAAKDGMIALQIRQDCDRLKDELSRKYHTLQTELRDGDVEAMTVIYVYLNMLQETQEMVSSLRKYVRAYAKLLDSKFSSRSLQPAN